MNISIRLIFGPLPPMPPRHPHGAGAVARFEGVVRPTENGRPLAALIYEDYEPLTRRQLHHLAEAIGRAHGLTEIAVEHSLRRVPAGRCSFRIDVAAPHRKAALRAMDEFIDRMKREVPLWKVPQFESDRAQMTRSLRDSVDNLDAWVGRSA